MARHGTARRPGALPNRQLWSQVTATTNHSRSSGAAAGGHSGSGAAALPQGHPNSSPLANGERHQHGHGATAAGAWDALVMSRRQPGRWCWVGSTQRGVWSQSRAGGSGGAELTPAPCVERGLQEVVEGSGTPNLTVGHHQTTQQDTTGTATAHPWLCCQPGRADLAGLCWARRQRGAGGMQQGRVRPQKEPRHQPLGCAGQGHTSAGSQEPACLRWELPGAGLCVEGVTNNQAKGRLNFLVIFSSAPWTVLLGPGYVAMASAGKGWGP